MRSHHKKGKQTKFVAPPSLTPQEASGSTLAIVTVTAVIIGALFWRARRSLKPGGRTSSQGAAVPRSAPAKTQGGRRVNNKKKSKSKKKQEEHQKETKKTKSSAPDDGGDSVLYTNHRYFRNPNGGAVPLAAPTPQPK